MLQRIFYTAGAAAALFIGLLGLLLPVIPGVLFLVFACVLLASASRRFRARLHASKRSRPYFERWEASAGLPAGARLRLSCLLLYACVTDSLRVTTRQP